MRLVTFDDGAGAPQAGVLLGEEIVPVAALDAPAGSVRGLLEQLDAAGLAALGERAARRRATASRARDVRLLAPVPDPEKIICMGLNYSRPRGGGRPGDPRAPALVRQVRQLARRRRRRRRPARRPRRVRRLRGRARGRDRPPRASASSEADALELRRRRDAAQRRQRARPAAAEPAVDERQGDRHVRPLRPGARDARRGRRPAEPRPCARASTARSSRRAARRTMIFGVAETIAWLSRTMTLVPGDIIATGHARRRRRLQGPLPARRRHRRGRGRRASAPCATRCAPHERARRPRSPRSSTRASPACWRRCRRPGRPRQSIVYFARDGRPSADHDRGGSLKARDVERTGWASLSRCRRRARPSRRRRSPGRHGS